MSNHNSDLQSEVAKSTREGIEQLYYDAKETGYLLENDSASQDLLKQWMTTSTSARKAKIAKYEEKIGAMEKTIEELREKEDVTIFEMSKKIKTKNTYILQILLVFAACVLYHFYK